MLKQVQQVLTPESIDTLIFLIRPNLAEIWACAHKDLGCMRASLHAQVKLCAQTGPACFPDSIDNLIFLIRHDLAEILACAHKHIACMHTSFHNQVKLCAQTNPACSPDSIDTLISDPNQFY